MLGALLSTAFGGLLLLLSQLLASWTDLDPPSTRTSSKKFEWQAQTPPPLVPRVLQSYFFLLNHPDKCEDPRGPPFLLMLVMTWPQEVGVRQVIQQMWGNETLVSSVIIRCLFVLGLPPPLFAQELQDLLEEEDREHGDLLQMGFLDTYHNLTFKVLTGLEWMAQSCPTAQYVLKVDSDIFVNPSYLVQQVLLPSGPTQLDFITDHIYKGANPVRKQNQQWYMSPELYSHNQYPDYCGGPGYVMSGSLALRILAVVKTIKPVHLEDVFVGLCLQQLGVKPIPSSPNTFLMFWRKYDHCTFHRLVLVHHF